MGKARRTQHLALATLLAVTLLAAGCGGSSSKTKIKNPPLTIQSSTLPAGQVGVFYFGLAEASGGQAPLTWTVAAGSNLPVGLTLDPKGAITGFPGTSGLQTFDLRVTDDFGTNQTGTHTIDIALGAPPTITSTSPLPGGNVGAAYAQTIQVSGGFGGLTFQVTAGNLPSGLDLDPSSGTISGFPRLQGTSNFDITVTDSATPTPGMDTANFDITIGPGVPADHLLINEFYTGGLDFAEIANPTALGQDLTGWTLEFYWLGVLIDAFPLPAFTLPAGEVLGIIEQNGTNSLGAPPYLVYTGWNGPWDPGDESEIVLRDNTGMGVDYLAVNPAGTTTHKPANLNWTGSINQLADWLGGRFEDVVMRVSFVDTDDASDFITLEGNGSAGVLNAGQAPATILITTINYRDGYENNPFFEQTEALGGLPPYTWSANQAQMPTGLTIDATTGAVNGTLAAATAGNYSIDVTVTDSQVPPATDTLPINLTVQAGFPVGNPMDVRLNEVGTGVDYVELINAGTGGVDIGGWFVRFMEDGQGLYGTPVWIQHFQLPQGLVLPPGQTLLISELQAGWLGAWEIGAGLINILWNGPVPGGAGLLDNNFQGIDYMSWESPQEFIPQGLTWPTSIPSSGTNDEFERSLTNTATAAAAWCVLPSGSGTPGFPNNCP